MKQPGGAFAFFGCALILWAAWAANLAEWKTGRVAPLGFRGGGGGADSVDGVDPVAGRGVGQVLVVDGDLCARPRDGALVGNTGKYFLNDFFFGTPHWDMVFWALALAGWLCRAVRTGKRGREVFLFVMALVFRRLGGPHV